MSYRPIAYLPLLNSCHFPINPYIRFSTWQGNNIPPPPGGRATTAEQFLAEYKTADHSIPADLSDCIDAYPLDEYLETATELFLFHWQLLQKMSGILYLMTIRKAVRIDR